MDWTKQQQRISDVKVTTEKKLDSVLLNQYERQLFAQTCNEVFDHVWQRYWFSSKKEEIKNIFLKKQITPKTLSADK